MTIQQLFRDTNISRYRLSKISGIPWSTLADIYSGKIRLDRCSVGTLSKLGQAHGLSIEELLELEPETLQKTGTASGNINRKTYLEAGLPESVQKAIEQYLQGEKEQVLYLDCLWGELYGAINSNLWAGLITEEQADYLQDTGDSAWNLYRSTWERKDSSNKGIKSSFYFYESRHQIIRIATLLVVIILHFYG